MNELTQYLVCFVCAAPVGGNRPLPEELKIGEPNLVIASPGEIDGSIAMTITPSCWAMGLNPMYCLLDADAFYLCLLCLMW